MDTFRSFSLSTNEKIGVELGKTFNNNMKPFETSKNNIDTEKAQIISTKELGENVQHKLLSFPNFSFCKLFEHEPEGFEERSRCNNKPSTSKNVEPKDFNVSVDNVSSNTVICDTIAKLNCTWINENRHSGHWQPCQSNKENIVSFASAFSPASVSFLADANQNDNSFYYKNNVMNSDSSIVNEKHCFDCNNSKQITLKLASRHCLPLNNLGHSFFYNYQKLSDYVKLENSWNIVQELLSSQISVCTSPESKIAVRDLIEKLLKRQSYISNDSFGKQKYCTMNLFHQLGETQIYEQSAGNAQAFLKHKLPLSDTMIAISTAREKKSLISLSRDIKVNATVISAPQIEMNKSLVNSDDTQLQQICEVTIDKSKNNTALIENITDQTFKIEPSEDLKPLSHHTLSKFMTNIFPQEGSTESFIEDSNSDCIVQNCNISLENQIVVQYPPLPGTMENTVEAKLLSNYNNNFPFFKGVDKCHTSFVQFKVDENVFCNPSDRKNSIDINERLASEWQLFVTLSKTNTYVKNDPCKHLEVQKQLIEGKSKSKFTHLSSRETLNKTCLNTIKCSQEVLNVNDLLRNEGALDRLNKIKCDVFDRVEVSETLNCNNLFFQTELSTSSSSDEPTNDITASNKIILDKTIQPNGDTLYAEYFDDDIDKAIDESIKKYARFTCDKGVLATPDTSDKSSQTDKTCQERQISCKRCLNFEGEDFRPSKSKRTKTYHDNSKNSKFSSCELVGTSSLTELMSPGIKYDFSSNKSCINLNGSNERINFKDHCTRPENNVLQIISKDLSLAINEDMKYNVNMGTLYGENSNLNDEFSLYNEEMDVEDESNWSKDSKEIHESDYDLSDHKVPVVEGERTELVKSK